MSLTQQGERLTEAHRLAQVQVSRQVLAQLVTLWPLLAVDDVDATRERWLEAAVRAVTNGAVQSVEVARRYYEAFRAAEIGGTLPAAVAAVEVAPDASRIASRLESAGPIGVKQATARGSVTPARDALVQVLGVGQRETLQPSREVIEWMMSEDERANKYARVTSGKACAFCLMLASRGPVYSKDTGGFRSHDACACSLEPEFDGAGRYNLPPSTFGAEQTYKAFLRDWEANPDKYEGLYGAKSHGDAKGAGRTASEARALGFRRYVEGRGPLTRGDATTPSKAKSGQRSTQPQRDDRYQPGQRTAERRKSLELQRQQLQERAATNEWSRERLAKVEAELAELDQ